MDDIYKKYEIDETIGYDSYDEENEVNDVCDVTKVRNDNAGFVGYFVEKRYSNEIIFLDYNHTLGSLDEYVFRNSSYEKTTYDLTQDPLYATIGFDPANYVVAEKFWGWGSWLPTGPCYNGHQTKYKCYYIFGIRTLIKYNVVNC